MRKCYCIKTKSCDKRTTNIITLAVHFVCIIFFNLSCSISFIKRDAVKEISKTDYLNYIKFKVFKY